MGLISCHDQQPRFLPFQTRVACEHLGRLVSMQIAAKEDKAEIAERLELRKLTLQIMSQLAQSDATLEQLTSEPAALLRLASASGAAVIHNDDCWTVGATPDHEQIQALARWVIASGESVCYRHRLADEFPPAAAYPELAAGLLAISISKVHRHLILWFRHQIMQTIEWAGDPRKALRSEDGRIHPRLSFANWKEQVSGQSTSWSPATVATAAELRQALVDIVLVRAEEMAEVSLELDRANQKISSFSYSVSHELRQPLISISGFSRVLLKRLQAAGDVEGVHFLDRILQATLQAEAITETLLELARISGVNLKRDVIDLSEEVATVMGKLREQEPARQVNVLIEPGMKASGDVKLLQVALAHLIGNAWKFTSTRANGEISIGSGPALNGARMWWIHDNGVGFDMAYSSKLFLPFHRLHDSGAFDGLGVGLAVAHAAITRHGGSIWADAMPDGGAKLYFTLGPDINSATAI